MNKRINLCYPRVQRHCRPFLYSLSLAALLVIANRQREHGLLVVRVQQWLPALRIEYDKVLFQELPNNVRPRRVAQEGRLGHRQFDTLLQIEANRRRQLLSVLEWRRTTDELIVDATQRSITVAITLTSFMSLGKILRISLWSQSKTLFGCVIIGESTIKSDRQTTRGKFNVTRSQRGEPIQSPGSGNCDELARPAH